MRHADAAAIKPIVNALTRVATSEHDHERYSREVRCDLVLLIDQFEELFAASVTEADRNAFIDLVALWRRPAASGWLRHYAPIFTRACSISQP